MNLCVTLTFAIGKSIHNAYGDIKKKYAAKQEGKQPRSGQEAGRTSSLPRTIGCPILKSQHNCRKRAGDSRQNSCPHPQRSEVGLDRLREQQHPSQPRAEQSPALGISSEARASAEAHAIRSRQQNYQRARDLSLALSLRTRVRRVIVLDTHLEEIDTPPIYNDTGIRLPDYEDACDSVTQNERRLRVERRRTQSCQGRGGEVELAQLPVPHLQDGDHAMQQVDSNMAPEDYGIADLGTSNGSESWRRLQLPPPPPYARHLIRPQCEGVV